MNPVLSLLFTLINSLFAGLPGLLGLLDLLRRTPLELTTGNSFVQVAWQSMTLVADSLLGFSVIVKAIQIMYSQSVGTPQMPALQLLPRVIRTGVLIHLSAFLGTQLVTLNNLLCSLISADLHAFILQQLSTGSVQGVHQIGVFVILSGVFVFFLLRLLFTVVKRVIFFNVLFILSGPAFLLSLDEQTAPWFSFWARTYVATAFSQFLQFLTFVVGYQFFVASKPVVAGLGSLVMAIVVLGLTAEMPGLLSRFAPVAGAGSVAGVGELVRSGLTAFTLFAP